MPLNNPSSEKLEELAYAPGVQTSDDLEAATKSITATSEQEAADYSSALTLVAPTDARMTVTRIGVRLQVTIDSFGGGGAVLNYRIKRGGTSIGTGTLATGGSTGAKLVVHDVTTGTLTGAATYTVFLWVDAGSCVVSLCQLWVGVGSTQGASNGAHCLRINHAGWIHLAVAVRRQGTGNFALMLRPNSSVVTGRMLYYSAVGVSLDTNDSAGQVLLLSPADIYFWLAQQSVSSDLVYISGLAPVLRSVA